MNLEMKALMLLIGAVGILIIGLGLGRPEGGPFIACGFLSMIMALSNLAARK